MDLKPCPFCGGQYTQVRFMGLKGYPSAFESGYRGECCDCGALTRAFRTEAGAANFWNTRAERTCRNTESPGEGFFTCSACGGSAVIEWTTSGWGKPNYCPNCGAKVVDE